MTAKNKRLRSRRLARARLAFLGLAVAAAAIACGGLRAVQYRELENQLNKLGDVKVMTVGGTEDLDLQRPFAVVLVGQRNQIAFMDLSMGAFDGSKPFAIKCLGPWGINIWRLHRRGPNDWLWVGGTDDDSIRIFGERLETPRDVVNRLDSLVASLERLPLKPLSVNVTEPSGSASSYARVPCETPNGISRNAKE